MTCIAVNDGFDIGLHLLEERQFLQLLLDGVGDLGLHFLRGGARPDRRDVDHLYREERVLGAAEPLVGEEAGGAQRDRSGTGSGSDGSPPSPRG